MKCIEKIQFKCGKTKNILTIYDIYICPLLTTLGNLLFKSTVEFPTGLHQNTICTNECNDVGNKETNPVCNPIQIERDDSFNTTLPYIKKKKNNFEYSCNGCNRQVYPNLDGTFMAHDILWCKRCWSAKIWDKKR